MEAQRSRLKTPYYKAVKSFSWDSKLLGGREFIFASLLFSLVQHSLWTVHVCLLFIIFFKTELPTLGPLWIMYSNYLVTRLTFLTFWTPLSFCSSLSSILEKVLYFAGGSLNSEQDIAWPMAVRPRIVGLGRVQWSQSPGHKFQSTDDWWPFIKLEVSCLRTHFLHTHFLV